MEINHIMELSRRAFQDLETASTNSSSWRRKFFRQAVPASVPSHGGKYAK